MIKSAKLVLEDGTQFHGKAIGSEGVTVGEVVFNTSMTGYQEILTDPSYARQIVTFTYPHIGNTGTNEVDNESSIVHAKGLAIRNLSRITSNYRSTLSLEEYLKKHNIVGISDIDTRKLTRVLRTNGIQNGCITSLDTNIDVTMAITCYREGGLVQQASTAEQYTWRQGSLYPIERTYSDLPYHIVVYDYGIKRNIMRMLVDRGCYLTILPAKTGAETALKMKPDGIFLSNGPGDPTECHYAISYIQTFLQKSIPLFGICLGHQLLALASGAKTVRMKFGHHGSNHPVIDLESHKVIITSQNHCFAVDETTLPSSLKVTHSSLFDGTLQGLHCIDKPAFSFQGHPEASPGPHDASSLFDHFIDLVNRYHCLHSVSGS